MTYNDILDSMKQSFYDNCGENADALGDIGARFQAVASELYSIACNAEYNFKQSFPQTATGNYLDKHAQLRGIERKQGKKAMVVLTFKLVEPAANEIFIPFGTICALSDKPYIQFETVASGIINVGSTSCNINARATEIGSQYNVGAGKITVLVNAPTGINSVTNASASRGGSDAESDDRLRQRIINAYSVPASGLTTTSMASVIEELSEVIECRIYQNDLTLNVYVRTADSSVSQDLKNKITNSLAISNLLGLTVNVYSVSALSFNLLARFKLSRNAPSDTVEKIKQTIKAEIEKARIGDTIELHKISEKCLKIEGVEQIGITTPHSVNNVISLLNNQYPLINSLEVEEYE